MASIYTYLSRKPISPNEYTYWSVHLCGQHLILGHWKVLVDFFPYNKELVYLIHVKLSKRFLCRISR